MAGTPEIARENGKKGGRPPGSKNKETIEKEAARKAFQQLVLERMRPIFEAQYSLARGITYMYRIEEKKNGAREHVLVTDPDEIGDILSQMDEGEPGVFNDQYYYITTKAPDNRAADSLLNRAGLEHTKEIDITSGGEKLTVQPILYANDTSAVEVPATTVPATPPESA